MPSKKTEKISDEMSRRIIATAERIATERGAQTVTVRSILQELGITNRVFYNRFSNVDEVLAIVYRNTSQKIRVDVRLDFGGAEEFFHYVTEMVVQTLLASYEAKMQFNQYVFETDSHSNDNYEWWLGQIKKLFDYAKEHGYIRDVDSDVLGYSLWCFCRGYNADAVGRNLEKEEAVRRFRYSFSIILDGLRQAAPKANDAAAF